MARLVIPDEPTSVTFDTASGDAFPFDFAIFAKTDLRITVGGLEIDQSAFTLAGTLLDTGGYQGGTVTLNTPAVGQTVVVFRDITPQRAEGFGAVTSVPVSAVDQALNRQMAVVQDLRRVVSETQAGAIDPEVLTDVVDGAVAGKQDTLTTLNPTIAPDTVGYSDAARAADQKISLKEWYQPTDPDFQNSAELALASGQNILMPQLDGGYPIHAPLTMAAYGNTISGHGATKSEFVVDSATFEDMDGPYVLGIPSSANERQATVDGIGIRFIQPDVTTRAGLTIYPYAISLVGASRSVLGNIRISGASHGIDATSNVGGLAFDFLDIGAFVEGFSLGALNGADPALDTVHGTTLKFWAHGFQSANRLQAFSDGQTVGFRGGRTDGLDIKTLSAFRTQVIFDASGGGEGAFGNIGHLALDSDDATLIFNAGALTIGSGYSTDGDKNNQRAIRVNGGQLMCGPFRTASSGGGDTPMIEVFPGGYATFTGGINNNITPGKSVFHNSGGELTVLGYHCLVGSNTTRTKPFFGQSSGKTTYALCRLPDKGTGVGNGISFATGDENIGAPNAMGGWTVGGPVLAGGLRKGIYGPNAGDDGILVQAAPSVLDIKPNYNTYQLNAGVPVGTFSGGQTGDVIHFQFGGNVQFVAGGNIHPDQALNANYRPDDTTSYQCLAGQWYEKGRQRNTPYLRGPRTVALADPLILVLTDSVVQINGSGGSIGTISPTQDGHKVTLRFNGATTVAGNSTTIKLRALTNLVTADRTTLELLCNGTEWVQTGGSVNS